METAKKEHCLIKEIRYRWWILGIIASAGFFLDWWTKVTAARSLRPGEAYHLLGHWFEFVLVYNKGAIFGIDPRAIIPGFPVNPFFSVFMIIAIIVLVLYYRSLKKSEILLHIGLSLILPGALGNLADRILRANTGVVDFIKVDLGFWPLNPWPVFNLADAYVTIGVGVILVSLILEDLRRKRASKAVTAAGSPGQSSNER